MLPFLPFGWALYGITALILMPYIKPLKKVFLWIAEKDGTGTAIKLGYKIAVLYRWSEKTDLSRDIVEAVNEAEENGNANDTQNGDNAEKNL